VLNATLPVGTKEIEAQTVALSVDCLRKLVLQLNPLSWIDKALKH
jgi:hypothetical protein